MGFNYQKHWNGFLVTVTGAGRVDAPWEVEFVQPGLQAARGAGGKSKRVPASPKVTIVSSNGKFIPMWLRFPENQLIPLDSFVAEAIRQVETQQQMVCS